jgi:hypothetical protein
LDPAALIKIGDFKTGDIANFDRVNEGWKIRKAVRRAGYLDVKISPGAVSMMRRRPWTSPSVNGAQYTMGKLTLVGLDLNGEAEVTHLGLEGKTFSPSTPTTS